MQQVSVAELADAYCCHGGLTFSQRRLLAQSLSVLGLLGLLAPLPVLFCLSFLFWIGFATLILWRLVLVSVGFVQRLRDALRPVHLYRGDHLLPVYSVLVPVYREAPVMAQLAEALGKLSWPAAKLDIQILIEADDIETLNAAHAADFPRGTRKTIVPPGGPRTKPNALNYGLARAYGNYVCIYDAEDRPHPEQLREAHAKFATSVPETVCVQAPLVGDNGGAGFVAGHWGLEYAVQFGLLLPAQAKLKLPISIGGTSNHFRTEAVKAAGGWDAWNVTEDADLGLRLARRGLRVSYLHLPTLEDAPERFGDWTAQRSRWIKGFILTWCVLMREPATLYRQLGHRGFWALQLTLGGAVLSPLVHGPAALMVLISVMTQALSPGVWGWGLLGAGMSVGILGELLAPGRWTFSRVAAILTRPLYWPLHSIAAGRAVWELAVRPYFWAKTPHQPHATETPASCSTGLSA
ncbi:MAG: glycosyltransferase family 2 protein [Henriciella sp.]|nr:glycosyltransferase family 2 protein [Henriciella sp.]